MTKGALNIYRDNFLEKEELTRLMSFIKDSPALFLFVSSTQSFGIIQQGASIATDPAFKIEVGTNVNTIKLVTDSYALDSDGLLLYRRAFDNFPIPTDDAWRWVKISHQYDNYEQGFIDIAVDGTLSGSGTSFLDVLRGASSGFPVKVLFYIEDDDGTLSTPNNSGIYEVTSVENDTTAVLSGNFVAENSLRYVVLGAFSIKTSIASITSDGIYSYDSCKIELIAETVADTPPTAGFTADKDFYVARVKSDGATVTVQDKRSNYYFRLNFGDIVVSNKAEVDASNVAGADITSWLAKLVIYTQSQIDNLLDLKLAIAQNLNDVASKTTARTNLGVYSTSYLDQFNLLITEVIVLGDWDMDADAIYGGDLTWATLGIDETKVVSVAVFIKSDSGVALVPKYPLGLNTSGGVTSVNGSLSWGDVGITLQRHTGGLFDSTDFDETSYSRGWVVINYTL